MFIAVLQAYTKGKLFLLEIYHSITDILTFETGDVTSRSEGICDICLQANHCPLKLKHRG